MRTRLGEDYDRDKYVKCDLCGSIWAKEFFSLGRDIYRDRRDFCCKTYVREKTHWICPYHKNIEDEDIFSILIPSQNPNYANHVSEHRHLSKQDKIKFLQFPIIKIEMADEKSDAVIITLSDGTIIKTFGNNLIHFVLRGKGGVLAVPTPELLNESETLFKTYEQWKRDIGSIEYNAKKWGLEFSFPEYPEELSGYEELLKNEGENEQR